MNSEPKYLTGLSEARASLFQAWKHIKFTENLEVKELRDEVDRLIVKADSIKIKHSKLPQQ